MSDKLTDNPIKPSLMESLTNTFTRVVQAVTTVASPSVDTGAKLDAVNAADKGSTVDQVRNAGVNRVEASLKASM